MFAGFFQNVVEELFGGLIRVTALQNVTEENMKDGFLRVKRLDDSQPLGCELHEMMLALLDETTRSERTQIDRDTAARDAQLAGNVRDPRPAAVFATNLVD